MKKLLIILLISVMALTLSCGGGGSSSAGDTTVSIAVSRGSSATSLAVQSLSFTISAPTMDTITRTVDISGQTSHTEHFTVPNGANRHFLVEAFGQSGPPLFQGDAFADLDGTAKQVNISMGFDVSGEWTITDPQKPETLFAVFSQVGNSLTVSIPTSSSGTFTGQGTSTGNDINVTVTGTDCEASFVSSFTGLISDDGSSISGNFTNTGGCGDRSGPWTAVRGHIVPQVDVTGTWSLFRTPTGQMEQGPVFLSFVQTGSAISISTVPTTGAPVGSGTITGNSVQLSFPGQDNCGAVATVSLTGTLSADGNLLSGNYTAGTGTCGQAGVWRATRALPPASDISGSWSATKTPNGGTAQSGGCLTFVQSGNFLTVSGLETSGFGIISGSSIQLLGFDSSNPNNIKVTSVVATLSNDGLSMVNGLYTTIFTSGIPPTETGTWGATKGTCNQPPPLLGTVSGTVTDAVTGLPLAAVNVGLFQQDLVVGIPVITGTDGRYAFTAPAGSGYVLGFSKTGYISSSSNTFAITDVPTTMNAVLSPVITAGQARIVLTWDYSKGNLDLDSYLKGPRATGDTTPGPFQTWFGDKVYSFGGITYANLDIDWILPTLDMPNPQETTTIDQQVSGTYTFYVNDFTNSGDANSVALSNSAAQITVYIGTNPPVTYNVPTGQAGTVWTVFQLNGTTLTPINTLSSDETVLQGASRTASSLKKKGKKR